jgi:hypothetical protein
MEREQLVKLMRDLISVAMGGTEKQDEFIMLAIRGTHNTEKQRLFKLIHRLIKARAEDDRFIDGRNEAAVAWAKKVVAADPDAYFPFI